MMGYVTEKAKGFYNVIKDELQSAAVITLESALILGVALGVAKYCSHANQQNINPPAQHQNVTPSQLENIATPEAVIQKK